MSGCRAGKGPPPHVRSPSPESVITKPDSAFEIPDSVITITAPAIMIARTVPNTRNQMPGIRWVEMTTTIISTMIMINQKVRSRSTGAINWLERRLEEVNVGRAKKRLEPKVFSAWVFPSRWYADDSLEWTRKATGRLRDLADLDFRPHDLRRTAASLMTSSGIQRIVVQKILNHVETGVTAVYDRYSYDNEKRVALEAWGRQVAAIVAGESSATKVLAFSRV